MHISTRAPSCIMFQVSVLLSDFIRDIFGAQLQSGCCTPRADGQHMMRLADPPLLSPFAGHSATWMLYLGTVRQSEITINPVGRAEVAGRAALVALRCCRGAGQRGV